MAPKALSTHRGREGVLTAAAGEFCLRVSLGQQQWGRRELTEEEAEDSQPRRVSRPVQQADKMVPGGEEAGSGGGQAMANDRVKNLQSEVEGVKNIMTQNVERILARGENLDHLRNKTEDLEATSEHFKTTSQKVARKYWWKNVKMIAIICVIVTIIIIFIILFATGVIPT